MALGSNDENFERMNRRSFSIDPRLFWAALFALSFAIGLAALDPLGIVRAPECPTEGC
jgi:hypothetical protein